jgi:hypothetical protein
MTEAKQKKIDKILDSDRQEAILASDNNALEAIVQEAALNLVVLEAAKAADQDLANLKEQVKDAEAVYNEGKKTSLATIELAFDVLEGRGYPVPSISDFVKAANLKKPETAEEIVRDAAAKLSKAAGPGGSVTISTPGGRSATIKGE